VKAALLLLNVLKHDQHIMLQNYPETYCGHQEKVTPPRRFGVLAVAFRKPHAEL